MTVTSVLPNPALNQIHQERLINFFAVNSPELLQYTAFTFLLGFAVAILLILITFGIFKAMSYFSSLSSF